MSIRRYAPFRPYQFGHAIAGEAEKAETDKLQYGSIRVYEWGPSDGHKILLVHGITTPCLALGGLAHGLVEKGYRVMLFVLTSFPLSPNLTTH